MSRNYVPISVIIPAYNAEFTILKTLHSLRMQTSMPSEIIIVNDCSDDHTTCIVNHFINLYPLINIKIISLQNNSGPSNARNIGIKYANNDLIALLDADDEFSPKKIMLQYELMKNHPDIFISGHGCNFNENIIDFSNKIIGFKILDNKINITVKNPFVTPSIIFRKSSGIIFDIKKKYCEDHYFIMEFFYKGLKIAFFENKLVNVNKIHGKTGISSSTLRMRLGAIMNYADLYKQKKIGIYFFTFLILYSFFKFIIYPFRIMLYRVIK